MYRRSKKYELFNITVRTTIENMYLMYNPDECKEDGNIGGMKVCRSCNTSHIPQEHI